MSIEDKRSEQTPSDWKHLVLVEQGADRFEVKLACTFGHVDAFLKRSAGIESQSLRAIPLGQALFLGAQVEAWLAQQEAARTDPRGRRGGRAGR